MSNAAVDREDRERLSTSEKGEGNGTHTTSALDCDMKEKEETFSVSDVVGSEDAEE